MPSFRNLPRQQGRSSARLEHRVPVAYDKEGWEVPVGETLQSLCLSRGSSPYPIPRPHHERVATSPSRESHPAESDDIMTSVPPSARSTRPRSASVVSTTSSAASSSSSPSSKRPSTTMPSKARSKPYSRSKPGKGDDYVRRPRNAFIVFRSHFNEMLAAQRLAEGPKTNQNTISKDAGKVWNDLPEAEKKYFRDLAAAEKAEHRRNHPGYRYAPHGSKSGKTTSTKAKSTSRAKKARKATPEESDDEADPEFGAEGALAAAPSAPRRSLRARPATRRYASPSPSVRSISPTPSASSSVSTQESVDEVPTDAEEEFVPTENIPHLALNPHDSKNEPTFAQTLHVDRHDIPAFMDNTKDIFGVDTGIIKTHALRAAHDAFLGDSSPLDPCDTDAGLTHDGASHPEACSSSSSLHPIQNEFGDLMEPFGGYDAARNGPWASSEFSASAEAFMDMFLDTSYCD